MRLDRFKRRTLGQMTLEELFAKRDEVLQMFVAEESVRVMSIAPFLVAWMATGKALDKSFGECAVWVWLGLAFTAMFLSQISSRLPWRVWVCGWGAVSVLLTGLHHEWKLLAIAGLGLATGNLFLAMSQEKRAQALGLAGKYDLLNANGNGRKGDVRSVEDILELHQEEERTAVGQHPDSGVPF